MPYISETYSCLTFQKSQPDLLNASICTHGFSRTCAVFILGVLILCHFMLPGFFPGLSAIATRSGGSSSRNYCASCALQSALSSSLAGTRDRLACCILLAVAKLAVCSSARWRHALGCVLVAGKFFHEAKALKRQHVHVAAAFAATCAGAGTAHLGCDLALRFDDGKHPTLTDLADRNRGLSCRKIREGTLKSET